VVGPSLGQDSIRAGVLSSLVGLLLIMLFMLWYYKLSGVNAIVALLFNLIILLGLMAYIGATMTLPGIAGFVLTMGVGVDSNVLIFERIKEELAAQRGVRASINAGFSRVFLTLLDTHIASLISAAFLFQFGTGPIRGFATTLSIGLCVNLFTSIFVSKTVYEMEMSARQTPALSI
jgi:preprotein translocase subunit SecD